MDRVLLSTPSAKASLVAGLRIVLTAGALLVILGFEFAGRCCR